MSFTNLPTETWQYCSTDISVLIKTSSLISSLYFCFKSVILTQLTDKYGLFHVPRHFLEACVISVVRLLSDMSTYPFRCLTCPPPLQTVERHQTRFSGTCGSRCLGPTWLTCLTHHSVASNKTLRLSCQEEKVTTATALLDPFKINHVLFRPNEWCALDLTSFMFQ